MTRRFHHAKLPDYSTLLSGRAPRDTHGFKSDSLQIGYNNTEINWIEMPEQLHYHKESDEIFVVLKGALHVNLYGEVYRIGLCEFGVSPRANGMPL